MDKYLNYTIYFTVFLIFIWCIITITKQLGPVNINNNKAYPEKEDTIDILLKRIEWNNNYNGRVNYFGREMFRAIIIVFALSILLFEKLPKGIVFIQMILVVLFCLYVCQNYASYHADKFSNYATECSLKQLRKRLKKLGLVKIDNICNENLSERKTKFSAPHECFLYQYKV